MNLFCVNGYRLISEEELRKGVGLNYSEPFFPLKNLLSTTRAFLEAEKFNFIESDHSEWNKAPWTVYKGEGFNILSRRIYQGE